MSRKRFNKPRVEHTTSASETKRAAHQTRPPPFLRLWGMTSAREATARHDATLATLRARWDARREPVRPLHADAAIDMVASTHTFSTTTALCDLGV
jgi:hypothetical protein